MKISREKAALGVFAVLALAGLAVLLTYIFTVGHSLNVAASSIDDATGSLDGYTALLYKGTAEAHTETVVDNTQALDGKLSSRDLNLQSTQKGGNGSGDEVSAKDAPGAADDDGREGARTVTLFSLASSYVGKQARVVEVDVADSTAYNARTVVRAGKYTFGFVSIDEVTAQPSYLAKRVADYDALGVDFVVCVVSDLSLLDDYDGADIVISAKDEGLSSHGALVDGVFYDDAPLVGQVGTILVSPSRTITAKDAATL